MKLLKSGFAFVIAVLTISLTIAAQGGAFKSEKKVASVQIFCDPNTHPVGSNENLYWKNVAGVCVLHTGSDVCENIIPPLFAKGLQYTEFVCWPTPEPIFCCAALGNQTCSLSGSTMRQIVQIVCGTIE